MGLAYLPLGVIEKGQCMVNPKYQGPSAGLGLVQVQTHGGSNDV